MWHEQIALHFRYSRWDPAFNTSGWLPGRFVHHVNFCSSRFDNNARWDKGVQHVGWGNGFSNLEDPWGNNFTEFNWILFPFHYSFQQFIHFKQKNVILNCLFHMKYILYLQWYLVWLFIYYALRSQTNRIVLGVNKNI